MPLEHKFTEKQMVMYRGVFESFDADGSGAIDTDELKKAFEALGTKLSDKDVADMIKEVDEDGSGEIDFDEFLLVVARQMESVDQEDELLEAFKVFDRDGDGYIKASELFRAMKLFGEKLSEEDCEEIVKEVAAQGERKISLTAFKAMMYEDE
eukprot:TRINITY_DN6774_c0_g1_i2.p1 TRINITY_DN6774_c0_g1~~TRINITY_DN6774_c0_g1_i2.p1  ORF type:complete len:153 (-),score=79.77 TRINITY_DN6774_c0_g1_i2:181-639(-)